MTEAITAIPVTTITGQPASLSDYDGQVRLVVNVASKCGLTPQYEGLEALYRAHREAGLVVLGFPANDFAGQEPGTEAQIAEFCATTFDVSFPMFAKLKVTGPEKHPLYAALTAAAPAPSNSDAGMRSGLEKHGMVPNALPDVLWNFEKFLIGRDGQVIARFAPNTAPDDAEFVAAIKAALLAKA
jgi:glutathione peroxidase